MCKIIHLTRLHCRPKCSTAAELCTADVKHYHLCWGNSDSCHKLSTHCQVTLSIPLLTSLQGNVTSFKQSKRQSLNYHRMLVIVLLLSSYPKLICRSKSNTDKSSTLIKTIRTHLCKLQTIFQNPGNQSACRLSAINDHSLVIKNPLAYTRIK